MQKNYIPVLDGNLDPLNEPMVISDLEQAKGMNLILLLLSIAKMGYCLRKVSTKMRYIVLPANFTLP